MSIPYVVRKKVHNSKEGMKELWYAVSKKIQEKGGYDEKRVARMIAQRTGFHRGEVEGLIIELTEIIEEALAEGHSVTLRGLGSFQTAVTSKGFEHPEQVTPGEVSVSRIYFIADRKMSKRIKEEPCRRIPFSQYFPKELLTKKMKEEDRKETI